MVSGPDDSILRIKLCPPRAPTDILVRDRLTDLVNEEIQRTLTLISAPAGYGKSTLASRWAQASEIPTGWVSLDEGDNDLGTFLTYVLAAIRSLFPKMRLRTQEFLEAPSLPQVAVLARYLLNDLHLIEGPCALVMDDYHHIRGGPVHDLLTELLTHPPQAMHLVLVTRRDPALPVSRLRARGLLSEIRAADLAFTSAEIAAFLEIMLKVPVDDNSVAILQQKTEGWATGLRLAGLYLRDRDHLERRIRQLQGNSRHITEYLLEEVLSIQNPEVAVCLTETSILDRFCAPLCQAVHSKSAQGRKEGQSFDAERFIESLLKDNLFVIPLDEEGYWFRYHHLFRDFLRAMLRKSTNADTVAGLHMRASNWFAENGLIEEAIRHALLAGDTQVAARLAVDHRYELLNDGDFFRLSRWLRLLPEEAFEMEPLLLTTKAFVGLFHGPESDRYAFTEKARRFVDALPQDSEASKILRCEIAVMQGALDIISGHPNGALEKGKSAISSLPKRDYFARTAAACAIAAGHQMAGDKDRGVEELKKMLAEPGLPHGERIKAWLYICILCHLAADSPGVLSAGLECLRIAARTRFPMPINNARYHIAAIHYLRNELLDAKSVLTSILRDRMVTESKHLVHACGILACIYLSEGRVEDATRIVESACDELPHMQDGYTLATRDALLVELAIRRGAVDEARRLSNGINFDLRPPHWFLYVPQLTPLRILLAEGTDRGVSDARDRLSQLEEAMSRIHRRNVCVDVLALEALTYRKLGDESTGLEKLRAALDMAEPGGWIRNFVDLGAPMRELLGRLSQADPGHAYAQQVLAACIDEAKRHGSASPDADERSDLSAPTDGILTQREIELLPLIEDGMSNKEIAARLYISEVTVKTHLQNIYRKLDAKGRIEALKKSRELDIIAHT